MHGYAFFDAFFFKTSEPSSQQDTVFLSALSYEDLNKNIYSFPDRERVGIGPFEYVESVNLSSQVTGDRYLRYKLVHKTQGIWKTVIDSVYLPVSTEVYRDTIYY
jgi:hypothetical protein